MRVSSLLQETEHYLLQEDSSVIWLEPVEAEGISSINLEHFIQRNFLLYRKINNIIELVSLIVPILGKVRNFNTSISLTSSVSKFVAFSKYILNTLGLLASNLSRNATFNRTISTSVILDFVKEEVEKFFRTMSTAIELSISEISTQKTFNRSLNYVVGLISLISRKVDYARELNFVIGIISSATQRVIYAVKNILGNISTSLILNRQVNWKRFSLLNLTLSSIVTAEMSINRSFSNTIGVITKSFDGSVAYTRNFINALSFNAFLYKLNSFFRTISKSISIGFIIERIIEYFRELSTTIGISSNFIKNVAFTRINYLTIGTQNNFSRILNIFRTIQIELELVASRMIKDIIKKVIITTIGLLVSLNKAVAFNRILSFTIGLVASLITYLFLLVGYKSIKFVRDIYRASLLNKYKNIKFWRRL